MESHSAPVLPSLIGWSTQRPAQVQEKGKGTVPEEPMGLEL